jgi:hypothetical protein
MTDDSLTQQHLGHVITADKRQYRVTTETGDILHEVNDRCSSAPLTNVQRGVMWLENHLGIAKDDDDEVGGLAVDIDQSVAIVQG